MKITNIKKWVFLGMVTLVFFGCSTSHKKEGGHEGTYSGIFKYGNFSDDISFEIKKDSTLWQVFFTSVEQNAFEIPLKDVEVNGDSINFLLQSDRYTYRFKNKWDVDNESLMGILKVDTISVPYSLKKEQATSEGIFDTKEVRFDANGLQLGGTIRRPTTTNNNKAIVFITSSGGADRSGSRAEVIYFTNKGYTTFHYDKRGTGISEGNWEVATMEELISDDRNAIAFFSAQTGIPLTQIGIKGSSQGATKIPYILNSMPKLKYGIAVSCPGTSLLESDLNYWKNRHIDAIADNVDAAMELQRKVFQYIAGTLQRPALEKALEAERTKTWFEAIWVPELVEVQTDDKLLYSPIPHFQHTKKPILIIQGKADEIIPPESHQLISDALKLAKNDSCEIKLLESANHAMSFVGKTDFPYWSKLHSEYLPVMSKWIDAITQ
tara:strand:- start:746 stop:2056 length:1311 start_codon:yes stop_codon:yes gene_type:complete